MANYFGSSGNDVITGSSAADMIYGFGGDDTLNGGAGNDEIDGGTGNDTMTGGSGDDIYWVDSASDVVIESSGGGIDLVRLQTLTYTLTANVENLDARYTYGGAVSVTGNSLANNFIMNYGPMTVDGGAGSDTVNYFNWNSVTVDLQTGVNSGAAADDTLISIENVTGSPDADILRGTSAANILDGWGGDDTLVGRGGSDIYYVDSQGDTVVENAGEGIDEIRTRGLSTYTLGANIENLSVTDQIAFTGYGNELNNVMKGSYLASTLYGMDGNDYLIGGSQGDHLYGGNGADTLDGGPGIDYMFGGDGNDVYIVNATGEQVTEYADEGIDTVYSSIQNFTLPDNFENLNGNAPGVNLYLIGNTLDNVINGVGGNEIIYGDDGNDTLNGNAGDDVILGEAGDDLIIGGWGTDILNGGWGADTFKFSSYESGTGSAADFIADFTPGEDRIDLTGVDANMWLSGDQGFAFIGMDDFSGTAGELRYAFLDNGNTLIQADVNGDAVSDFEIVLQGYPVQIEPVASDFML
jgi:Ca2+-binding RTX toxin-like protein